MAGLLSTSGRLAVGGQAAAAARVVLSAREQAITGVGLAFVLDTNVAVRSADGTGLVANACLEAAVGSLARNDRRGCLAEVAGQSLASIGIQKMVVASPLVYPQSDPMSCADLQSAL